MTFRFIFKSQSNFILEFVSLVFNLQEYMYIFFELWFFPRNLKLAEGLKVKLGHLHSWNFMNRKPLCT